MKKQRGALLDEHGNPLRNAIDIPMAGGQQIVIWHDSTGDSAAPDYRGTWLCHQGNFVELGRWDPLALAAFPTNLWERRAVVPSRNATSGESPRAHY